MKLTASSTTSAQGGQNATNAYKLCFYANIVTADIPSVAKTVVSHKMREQRNEERDRVSLAVNGLPGNGQDIRDFEGFLWELQF